MATNHLNSSYPVASFSFVSASFTSMPLSAVAGGGELGSVDTDLLGGTRTNWSTFDCAVSALWQIREPSQPDVCRQSNRIEDKNKRLLTGLLFRNCFRLGWVPTEERTFRGVQRLFSRGRRSCCPTVRELKEQGNINTMCLIFSC